jgi:putative endonuclease
VGTGDRRARGAAGEALAAAWYEAAGYDVVDRNWRCRDGELDLVCRLGATIVFCEVKARRTAAYGMPAEAVTAAKRRRIRRLAARWLADRDVRGAAVRFDVAAVLGSRVEVITDAF